MSIIKETYIDTTVKVPSATELGMQSAIPGRMPSTGASSTFAISESDDDIGDSSADDSSMLDADSEDAADSVSEAIEESHDLIEALESVGAMYGIPSSNIIVDNSLSGIRVVDDCIMAPSGITNVKGNMKAIMRSIGCVLDHISQRIDNKLDTWQNTNVTKGRISEHIVRDSNPAKGKVIARYEDSNGDEILVYDSGLLDMANTKEAHRKVEELKRDMKIPEYNPHALEKKTSYFTDEDDISAGTDVDTSSADAADTVVSDDNTTDVSSDVQESYKILDAISRFNNTTHLGYDLLRSQGFNFIEPVNSIVQESASSKKQKKSIKPSDIKYMKFDNTNLIKAIKYFNAARAEQSYAKKGSFSIPKFINSKNYQNAIDCLNKQFNARINVRFVSSDNGQYNNLYTSIWNNIKNNLSISKSKGFQLNGLPIDIFVIDKALDEDAPDDISLFGQNVASTFCHEIFHNIMSVLRYNDASFNASLMATLTLAGEVKSAKNRRKLITNFVNTLDEINGMKMNIINRRALVKRLTVLSTVQHDQKALDEFTKALDSNSGTNEADKDIDKLIKTYEKYVKTANKQIYSKKYMFIGSALIAACMALGFACPVTSGGVVSLIVLTTSKMFIKGVSQHVMKAQLQAYRNGDKHKYEEYWCDMFAAMYNLPVTFFFGRPRKYVANQISDDKLQKLTTLERELSELTFSTYPSTEERVHAAVKISKRTLESGERLEPSIKKYLEWIVQNYSSILNTDIEEIYNKTTFDPKTADDLDKHLQNIISSGNITLTESFIDWFVSDACVITESVERINDDGDVVPEYCEDCGAKINLYIDGEPVWRCSNKKCKKYYGTLPCSK
jgi:tetratricopeptide (TPR) repeat protein